MQVLSISARFRDTGRITTSAGPFSGPLSLGDAALNVTPAAFEDGSRLCVNVQSPVSADLADVSIEVTVPEGFHRGTEDSSSVFINGFQSWTESREYRKDEKIRGIRPLPGRLFKLNDIGDYHFAGYTGKPGRFHSYTYTYVRHADDTIDFYGSTGEESGYTIFFIDLIRKNLTARKDLAGTDLDTTGLDYEILHLRGTEEEVFSRYARELGISSRNRKVFGWTSWYKYYKDISEEIMLENLEAFAAHSPASGVFQIDDGYETRVGDWLSIKSAFPGGMKYLADAIRQKGFTPGLWLAPFICERKSRLAREHEDWILRDERGRKVTAGWIPLWSGTAYALDIYHEEFRAYLTKVFKTVFDEWGYGMVKLDFLYAAAMIPGRGRNRGQIMADGCRLLRELAGDHPILGCGVPLGSCFNLFEYCRIGSDVGPKWEDPVLKYFRYRERVSTRNSLKSTIGRRHLGGRIFVNDPDVFILRKKNTELTEDQKYTLFLLNNLFGQLVFTSDNVALYDESVMPLFRSMFPLQPKQIQRVKAVDQLYTISCSIGNMRYQVYANLSEEKRKVRLEDGSYYRGPTLCRSGGPQSGGTDVSLSAGESLCLLLLDDAVPADANLETLFPGNGG